MVKNSLIILLSIFALSCVDKKEKPSIEKPIKQIEKVELNKEIDSLETITKKIEETEESIESSIEKLDGMLNEIKE